VGVDVGVLSLRCRSGDSDQNSKESTSACAGTREVSWPSIQLRRIFSHHFGVLTDFSRKTLSPDIENTEPILNKSPKCASPVKLCLAPPKGHPDQSAFGPAEYGRLRLSASSLSGSRFGSVTKSEEFRSRAIREYFKKITFKDYESFTIAGA